MPAESNINPNPKFRANKTGSVVRASSAYVFPRNVMVSANFEHGARCAGENGEPNGGWNDSVDQIEGRAHRAFACPIKTCWI